jgi:DNA repair protein RecN (Recombination protein N)
VTTADVTVLSDDARVTELARMLGGDPESDVSRAHARELLETASAVTAPVVAVDAAPRKTARRR